MTITRDELSAPDLSDITTGERSAHVTPGDVLRAAFMEPLGLSARGLAFETEVPVTRITDILHGERAVTADTALRPGRRFGVSGAFWLGLQNAHDLEVARAALGWAA